MQPKNIIMYRFPRADIWSAENEQELESALAAEKLRPVGPLELSAAGFVPPMGPGAETMTHRASGAIWVRVGFEAKILPAAVVNDLMRKRVAELEKFDGRRPGGRARKCLREDLVHELLPRAFVRPSVVDAMIDPQAGVVAIDTASRKVAETVVGMIRRALGSFPALPLDAEIDPRVVMTGWVTGETMPETWTLGDSAQMRDVTGDGAVVKVDRHELQGDEVRGHLNTGMQVARLAVEVGGHVAMVACEDLVIRKFKLLDGALEKLESTEREDLRAEMDARFALFVGEFRRVFGALEQALQVSGVEGE